MNNTNHKRTIQIDFDGTICDSKGMGFEDISMCRPLKGAFETMCRLRVRGFEIVVFTARDISQVGTWMFNNWPIVAPYGDVPQVTNTKQHAICYIDDKAIHFTNWDKAWEDLKPLIK